MNTNPQNLETATFGGGCFWCLEPLFDNFKGVTDVVSGYAGGHSVNPTYQQVCSETTGHAEVIQVTYDPTVVTYGDLLELFWRSHDPTQKTGRVPMRGRNTGRSFFTTPTSNANSPRNTKSKSTRRKSTPLHSSPKSHRSQRFIPPKATTRIITR